MNTYNVSFDFDDGVGTGNAEVEGVVAESEEDAICKLETEYGYGRILDCEFF